MENKKKKKIGIVELIVYTFILLGLLLISYPLISQYYYRYEANQEIEKYKKGIELIDQEEINRRTLLAQAYNDSLLGRENIKREDPFSEEQRQEGRREYARMLEVNELIGYIKIPSIGQELPVRAGTSEEVLQKYAGHMENTSLPIGGASSHSVITAHRGLPKARLFTDLDKVKLGDRFYFTNIKETIAYQVDEITVIEPDQFEYLDLVEGKDYMTLLTCTPYMVNSHRLLVRGSRIAYYEDLENDDIDASKRYVRLLILSLVLAICLLVSLRFNYKKHKELKGLYEYKKEGQENPDEEV